MSRGIIADSTMATSPGASTTITLYDDGDPADIDSAHGKNFHRHIHIALLADQVVTIAQNWHPLKGGTPQEFDTLASTINVGLDEYFSLLPGRNQITLTTTTDPSTFLLATEWVSDTGA